MKGLIVSLMALATAGVLAATPAAGEAAKKTELVALGGKSVDRMQLRYDFESAWVVDNQNILYRDVSRDYYLVTLKKACAPLEIRSLSFSFHPAWSWQLLATHAYEVRPRVGSPCDVAKVEQIDDAKADPLRDAAAWRSW